MKKYNGQMTMDHLREEQMQEHKRRVSAPQTKSDLTSGMTELDRSTYDKLLYTDDNRICFMLGEDKGQRWYYGLGSLHLNMLGTILTMLDEKPTETTTEDVIKKIVSAYGEREVMEVLRHSTRNLAKGNLNFSKMKTNSRGSSGKPRGW